MKIGANNTSASPDFPRQRTSSSQLSGDETYAHAVSMSPRRAWEIDGDADIGDETLGNRPRGALENPSDHVNKMIMSQKRRNEILRQLELEREERRSKALETGTSSDERQPASSQPGADALRKSAHQQRQNVLKMLEARRLQRQREAGMVDAEPSDATTNGIMSPPESNKSASDDIYNLDPPRRTSATAAAVAGATTPSELEERRSGGSSVVVANNLGGTLESTHRRRQRPVSAPRERTSSRDYSNDKHELEGSTADTNVHTGVRYTPHTPSRHSKEAVMERVRRQSIVELTFKPELIAQQARRVSWGEPVKQIGARTIERLSKPRTDFYMRMSEKKAELQERETEGLTFQPKTLDTKNTPESSLPVEERLFHGTERRFLVREKAKRAMEAAEVAQYSFRPCISRAARRKSGDYRPLSERIGELQRQKNESLMRLRMSTEFENPDMTFQPQLNEKSKRIADAIGVELVTQTGMSVTDRLSSGVSFATERRRAKEDRTSYESFKDCTFQPKINPTSEMLVEDQDVSFLERQNKHIVRREQRLMQKMRESCNEYTFKPDIQTTSDVLKKSRHSARENETMKERVERMSRKESKLQENKKDNIKDEYYKQFSYKPKVNKISDKLARSTPLSELVQNQRHKLKMKKVTAKVEQETMKECTFKPSIAPRSRSMTPQPSRRILVSEPETLTERAKEREMQREAAMEEIRKSRDFEELRDCSFTPKINRRVIKAKGPVVVRGLVRHLEVQQNANRKAQEKKSREDKAFYRKISSSPVCYTVPEPFDLTETNKEAKLERAKRDAEASEMAECTFRPSTNAQKSRALLRKLLAD